MLEQALRTALFAGAAAAVAGAFAGALLLGGLDLLRTGARHAPTLRIQVGTFLLAAHVVAAATLWVVPQVGSCVAAALGSGWIGAAAGNLVLLAAAERGLLARLIAGLVQAGMGLALWAPLWAFIRVMKAHSMPTMIA